MLSPTIAASAASAITTSIERPACCEARIAAAIRLVSPGTVRPEDSAPTMRKSAAVDEQRRQVRGASW